MNVTTENLTLRVKDMLLALSDEMLMDTVLGWIERTNEMHQHLGDGDELRLRFGYQLQSGETEEIYGSFAAFDRSESETAPALWIAPSVGALRKLLSNFSLPDFRALVIPLADDAIAAVEPHKDPGWPSTGQENGQPFMRCLTPYLQKKADQEPENQRYICPRRVARISNSIPTAYNDTPCFEMMEVLEPCDD